MDSHYRPVIVNISVCQQLSQGLGSVQTPEGVPELHLCLAEHLLFVILVVLDAVETVEDVSAGAETGVLAVLLRPPHSIVLVLALVSLHLEIISSIEILQFLPFTFGIPRMRGNIVLFNHLQFIYVEICLKQK